MTASSTTQSIATRNRLRAIIIVVAAATLAVALNAVIAAVATTAGPTAGYGPLTLPAYALFTVLGFAAGWVGWVLIHRRARDPRRVLLIVVPVLTVLSFVPDILLLAFGFIPGTTVTAAIALMLMHVVVVAVAVPAFSVAYRPAR